MDYVIFYPYVGGQFNPHPGAFIQYIFDKAMEAGADVIIVSHAYIVKKAHFQCNILCAHSLGNFNMDYRSDLVYPQALPGTV